MYRPPAPTILGYSQLATNSLPNCPIIGRMLDTKTELCWTLCSLPGLVGELTSSCHLLVHVLWGFGGQGLVQENDAVVSHELPDRHPSTSFEKNSGWCEGAQVGLVLDHLQNLHKVLLTARSERH